MKLTLEEYLKISIEERYKEIIENKNSILDLDRRKKLFCLLENNYHAAKQFVENYELENKNNE